MSPRLVRQTKKEQTNEGLSRQLVTVGDPASGASEAYRALRTNLLYATVDAPPKVIALTSHGPMEGKSITCANLGVVLAQAGRKVLVVDCDFRKPALQQIFALPNSWGTVNVLAGEHSLQEVWQEVQEAWQEAPQNLKVLTVGPVPPDPAELLSSERFAELMTRVRQEFDYVLLDAPPANLSSDAAVLARQADGTLLVLDAQKTRKGDLRRAVRSLQTVGTNILGTVMNNVEDSKGIYSRYN